MSTVSSDLVGQRTQRIAHRDTLKSLGIDPYPATASPRTKVRDVIDNYDQHEGNTLVVSGRLTRSREHGKLIFGDIRDDSGTLQIAIKQDALSADRARGYLEWPDLKLLDLGDIVECHGKIGKTQQGAITVFAIHIRLLSKSLRPFPQTFDDKELQFRRRYIDLVVNADRKARFERKALFWNASRDFMTQHGFIEVETPVLEHVTGGADARPFVTHHNTLDQDFYLRISTELYQKRLIGGGFEKIYTIGPNFRNEGSSDEHLQEFYQLEWYWAYADYRDNMKFVRDLFRHLAQTIYGKTKFSTRGHTFDLADEWTEIDYVQVIREKLGIDIFEDTDDTMLAKLKEKGVELSGAINRNRLIDNLWKVIRKEISGPAFLVNEPAFMSPLAKAKTDDPRLTERYHVILAGSELGNGYSEINDPEYQLAQFLDQQKMRDTGDDEAQMLDIDYVEMLEFGMPPVSGHGHSERLFWFFEDITGREGTLFPQLRHEVEKLTKEIYPHISFAQKAQSAPASPNQSDVAGLPTREQAHELLEQHVQEPYQRLHAQMVARAMERLATDYNDDADLWYITGLLHDLDYNEFPDAHPNESLKWFAEWKYPEQLIHAVAAHAQSSGRTDIHPKTQIDFALIACDELSGLLYAYSLMRPTGFDGMEAKSVVKKFKDKAFAAKIDRTEIMTGVEGLGLDLKEHIQKLIDVFAGMEELKK